MLSLSNFIDCDGGHGWRVPEPVHAVDPVVLENLPPFFLFPCCVFCIRARILEIASHGVLWGWFEPRYWNLFEYSVDCADSGGRPSDGCDEFSNGRGQSVLVR